MSVRMTLKLQGTAQRGETRAIMRVPSPRPGPRAPNVILTDTPSRPARIGSPESGIRPSAHPDKRLPTTPCGKVGGKTGIQVPPDGPGSAAASSRRRASSALRAAAFTKPWHKPWHEPISTRK